MKIIKEIKTYLPFSINVFQRNLAYRANAIVYFLGDAVILAVTYFLWKAIYLSSPNSILNGFSFYEMIVYVLMSFITGALINADIVHGIYREVKDGSIAINLIRPINYERRILFENFGGILYNFLVIFLIGFIGIIVYMHSSGVNINLFNILLYFLSIIFSILITFYSNFSFSLLSFKITNMWGLSQMMSAITQLLSGALIPIIFFPTWLRGIVSFFPFSSMIYTPTMIFLGKLSSIEILQALSLQIFWIIITMIISKTMWKKLIKQLTILGG